MQDSLFTVGVIGTYIYILPHKIKNKNKDFILLDDNLIKIQTAEI